MSLISKKHLNVALQSVKKLFDKRIKDSTADWSQNDSSADNHVKNRTHWEETSTVIFVDSLTSEDYRNGNYPKCTFVPGQKYNVVWNSVLYEDLVCWFDGEYNVIASQENGTPFYIDDDGGNGLYIETAGEDEAFTVSISITETVTHKLDPKYLPDDIGVQADWNQNDPEAKDYIKNKPFGHSKYFVLIDETITIVEGSAYFVNRTGLAHNGEKYIVTFDGVEYTGTVWDDSDACTRTDFTTDDGTEVHIRDTGSLMVSGNTNLDGDHTIKIVVERDGYNQISLRDIPDSIQRVNDAVGKKGIGECAEVFNVYNAAIGSYSSAKGYRTEAHGDYSDVSGKYNLRDLVYEDDGGTSTSLSAYYSRNYYYSETAPTLNTKTGKYDTSNFLNIRFDFLSTKENVYFSDAKSTGCSGYYFKEGTEYTKSGNTYTFTNVVEHKAKASAANKYARIVGNGKTSHDRSNAHTLDWEGNAWYQGDVYVGGDSQDEGSKKLATEAYVNTQIEAIPTPDVSGQISAHNTATDAHKDIRLLIENLSDHISQSFVAQPEAPEDTSVLWLDTDDDTYHPGGNADLTDEEYAALVALLEEE